MPAAAEELLKPFVVKHPHPNSSLQRREDLARLRQLCAEMKKRLKEETNDGLLGDINALIPTAFSLAHKLDYRNPPVEVIHYERGKKPQEHHGFGWGPLPSLWPLDAMPHIMRIFGYRLHNPSFSYTNGPLQVIQSVIAENKKPTGPLFGAEDTGSKTAQRAEATVILNRWVDLLDQAITASTSDQNSPMKAKIVAGFISTVNQLIGALKDLPSKEAFAVGQPTYKMAEQLGVLAKDLGFGFAPITFLENEVDIRTSRKVVRGEALKDGRLINLVLPLPRVEVRDPFNAGTSAYGWDLLKINLTRKNKAQLIRTLKVWSRNVNAMRRLAVRSKKAKSPTRLRAIKVSVGHLSPTDLAHKYGTPAEATRKMLDRWRSRHTDGYVENDAPRPNEPKFLYLESAVAPAMLELRSRHTKRKTRRTKTSDQRPAEQSHGQSST